VKSFSKIGSEAKREHSREAAGGKSQTRLPGVMLANRALY
jgi:hypothetical protein